jgi:hypothetical protein
MLKGFDRPLRIAGLSVSPRRLSDSGFRGVVQAMVGLKRTPAASDRGEQAGKRQTTTALRGMAGMFFDN